MNMNSFLMILILMISSSLQAEYDRNYFFDDWIASGYACNSNTPDHEEVKIHEEGDELIAIKTLGDDCVTTGHETFRSKILPAYDDKIFYPSQWVLGNASNPNAFKGSSGLKIIDIDSFQATFYNIIFRRKIPTADKKPVAKEDPKKEEPQEKEKPHEKEPSHEKEPPQEKEQPKHDEKVTRKSEPSTENNHPIVKKIKYLVIPKFIFKSNSDNDHDLKDDSRDLKNGLLLRHRKNRRQGGNGRHGKHGKRGRLGKNRRHRKFC